jgi:hypothetical protein
MTYTPFDTEILVVGAGPTGLMTANGLRRFGLPCTAAFCSCAQMAIWLSTRVLKVRSKSSHCASPGFLCPARAQKTHPCDVGHTLEARKVFGLEHSFTREIAERPENYLGPDLNPEGLILHPQELAKGVYALMANIVPKDNNGVIVGDKGVLVVDAGINGSISQQIQQRVRELTDKPIRYLVRRSMMRCPSLLVSKALLRSTPHTARCLLPARDCI